MLRLPEQAGDFSCLWTRKVYWQGMLWVQLQPLPVDCGAIWTPIFPAGLDSSCGVGMNPVEAWCGSVLRRLQALRLSPHVLAFHIDNSLLEVSFCNVSYCFAEVLS